MSDNMSKSFEESEPRALVQPSDLRELSFEEMELVGGAGWLERMWAAFVNAQTRTGGPYI